MINKRKDVVRRQNVCLPFLVEWSYLVPLISTRVVAVYSRDLLTCHPVSSHYEEVVVQDSRAIPSNIDHIWRQVVCQRFPSLFHLSVPQHRPWLILIRYFQRQTGEVSNCHQGSGAFHAHVLDLLSDTRWQAAKLWSPTEKPATMPRGLPVGAPTTTG